MAFEDFSTYTEVDLYSYILVDSTSKASFVGITRSKDAFLYSDKGDDHFDADFIHTFEVQFISSSISGATGLWGLQNDIEDSNHSNNNIIAYLYYTREITLRERHSGSTYWATTGGYVLTEGVTYYCEVERDESVGTYGTMYLRIYSDPGRTILLKNIVLALHGSKKDWRYVYAINSYKTGANYSITGFVQNLDLQEGDVVTPNYAASLLL